LNRIFRENGDRAVERVAVYLQDNATSIKSQYYGFRNVCRDERGVTPEIQTVDWENVTVSDEVRKIAENFAAWDEQKDS
jgi:hypothetical protein